MNKTEEQSVIPESITVHQNELECHVLWKGYEKMRQVMKQLEEQKWLSKIANAFYMAFTQVDSIHEGSNLIILLNS